jgi:hypothetical protein
MTPNVNSSDPRVATIKRNEERIEDLILIRLLKTISFYRLQTTWIRFQTILKDAGIPRRQYLCSCWLSDLPTVCWWIVHFCEQTFFFRFIRGEIYSKAWKMNGRQGMLSPPRHLILPLVYPEIRVLPHSPTGFEIDDYFHVSQLLENINHIILLVTRTLKYMQMISDVCTLNWVFADNLWMSFQYWIDYLWNSIYSCLKATYIIYSQKQELMILLFILVRNVRDCRHFYKS